MPREERGQLREEAGEHAEEAPFGDTAELAQTNAGGVECERQRLAVEVAAGEYGLVLGEDQRIVGAGIELHSEHASQVVDGIVAGTVHLSGAAQGAGVLNAVAEDVRFGDAAAVGQGEDAGGGGDLPRMRPRRVAAWIDGAARAAQP